MWWPASGVNWMELRIILEPTLRDLYLRWADPPNPQAATRTRAKEGAFAPAFISLCFPTSCSFPIFPALLWWAVPSNCKQKQTLPLEAAFPKYFVTEAGKVMKNYFNALLRHNWHLLNCISPKDTIWEVLIFMHYWRVCNLPKFPWIFCNSPFLLLSPISREMVVCFLSQTS